MKEEKKNGRTQGGWQEEVRKIALLIREHQAVINHLRAQKRQITEKHRRRQQPWDNDTPLSRLVNPQRRDAYNNMIREWQRQSKEELIPSKTIRFLFIPTFKWHVIRALANVLTQDPPVFKVSTLQLCRYLAKHSNLGTAEGIKKALQRMKKIQNSP